MPRRRFFSTRNLAQLALVLTVASLATVGCSDNDNAGPTGIQPDPALLRAIHLSPNAPGVDIFLNASSQAAVSDLKFEQGTGYLEVDSGTYQIDVAPTGATPDDAVLSVPGLQLSPGMSYTAVAFDELSSISALALVDDTSGLAAGSIRVRAIHTAATVGQVDIWNIPASGSPSMLYPNVDFGVASDYLEIPAGAYTLGFDVDDDEVPDVVFALPDLDAGTVANVFAVSNSMGSVYLLAQLQNGAVARIDAQ